MLSYFAFIHSGIQSAGNPLSDGRKLAQHCLAQLEALKDSPEFPPRLLILLASPAYVDSLKSEQLLSGVNGEFQDADLDVPLIGSSVAAVFFDQHIYREGALLVCLASRLLEAKVRAVQDASQDAAKAVSTLLDELSFRTKDGTAVHSFVNRSLMAFFPGFGGNKYLAPSLHKELRKQTDSRISIFGGVASANDPKRMRSGILFANKNVHRDAIVAARLEHGTPFSFSLTQGLVDANRTVSVARIDPLDHRIIKEFREGSAREVMNYALETTSFPLFASLAIDREPIMDLPVPQGDTLQFTRPVHEGDSFRLYEANPVEMRQALKDGVKQSMRRAFLLNPISALGLRCTGILRNEQKIGLNLEHDAALIEHELFDAGVRAEQKPYVGGFVDGEAGLDHDSKSVLTNWGSATMVFGDELRFRTPVYRGFEKVTEFAGLKMAESQKGGIDRLTNLIYEIGFSGAMLSFCLFDGARYAIVGKSASGPRYNRLLAQQQIYSLDSDDVLAVVGRARQSKPIIDSAKEDCFSMQAASAAGIVSQYMVPLIGSDDQLIAILQIDLGDLSYDNKLYETETSVLDALGNIVGAALNRMLIWEEGKLISALDRAMSACQSAQTIEEGLQQYLEYALDAFGLSKGDAGGHIRIAQDNPFGLSRDNRYGLRLVAGKGSYYEVANKHRRKIDFDDPSPTAHAFRNESLVIINDPQNNEVHRAMCEQWEDEPEMHQRLKRVGSYANVPFISERGERGTINLVAEEPWFFATFHRPVLEALGHRVGFLLETLRRKERESYLLAVSPKFFEIRKFEDFRLALGTEIERFAGAINAEIASLYLWDEDRERYILRAQYNWASPEWLDAAYYEKDDFWTGTYALAGRPHYIPNLFEYYEKYKNSNRRHAADAFGRDLSEEFTVEAIALQLRIGTNRFGVVTCYRTILPDTESGFVTTNTQLLQQGADNFASLISILESSRREIWRKHEHQRRQEVFDSMPAGTESDSFPESDSFEYRVGRQVLISYHAIKVNFFKVNAEKNLPRPVPQLSLVRNPITEELLSLPTSLKEDELRLVRETIESNYAGKRELGVSRIKISEDERDPQRVGLTKLVDRVCIPLFCEKQLVGALDIHWTFDHASRHTIDYQHGNAFLLMLGDMIGAAYGMDQLKRQTEEIRKDAESKLTRGTTKLLESETKSRDAVQVTTAYVLQHHNELRYIITRMRRALKDLRSLRKDGDENEMEALERLAQRIKEGTGTLKRMIEIGRKMSAPNYERRPLRKLILSSLEKSLERYPNLNVEVPSPSIPDNQIVSVDPSLIRIVFNNLLDNSLKSMKRRKLRKLTIKAESVDRTQVTLTIEDTGKGMSKDKIRLITKEFYSINNRISVGVTIARLILAVHGGRLTYNSIEGDGTQTIISLPLD